MTASTGSFESKPAKLKVQVWIFSIDTIGRCHVLLLHTHAQRGSFWQPVTGSVENGESLIEASIREAEEETGLSFEAAPHPIGFEFSFVDRYGEPVRETVFKLEVSRKTAENVPIRVDSHEHDEARWFLAEEAFGALKFESNISALEVMLKQCGSKGPNSSDRVE